MAIEGNINQEVEIVNYIPQTEVKTVTTIKKETISFDVNLSSRVVTVKRIWRYFDENGIEVKSEIHPLEFDFIEVIAKPRTVEIKNAQGVIVATLNNIIGQVVYNYLRDEFDERDSV